MAKKRTTKAAKPKTERKKKTKAGVPGSVPGHNSGDESPPRTLDEERELFASHRRAWANWQNKLKIVQEFERYLHCALKGDGFSVKQMQIADQLGTVKGEIKVTAEVKDRLRVAQWIGHPMGAQLDMFAQPDRTPLVDRAYEEGKTASIEDRPAKPPHSPETEAFKAWMSGYHDHQREIVGGMKAPDETAH